VCSRCEITTRATAVLPSLGDCLPEHGIQIAPGIDIRCQIASRIIVDRIDGFRIDELLMVMTEELSIFTLSKSSF
jgi:hypothetical protein